MGDLIVPHEVEQEIVAGRDLPGQSQVEAGVGSAAEFDAAGKNQP